MKKFDYKKPVTQPMWLLAAAGAAVLVVSGVLGGSIGSGVTSAADSSVPVPTKTVTVKHVEPGPTVTVTAKPIPEWQTNLNTKDQKVLADLQTNSVPDEDLESAVSWVHAYCKAIPNYVTTAEAQSNTKGLPPDSKDAATTVASADLCPNAPSKVVGLIATHGKTEKLFLSAVIDAIGPLSKSLQRDAISEGWSECSGDGYDPTDDSGLSDGDYGNLSDDQVITVNSMADSTLCPTGDEEQPSIETDYVMKVIGNGTESSVITRSENGQESQDTNVHLPWTHRMEGDGGSTYLSAQDGNGTSITCEILDPKGKVVQKNTATGAYSICTLS